MQIELNPEGGRPRILVVVSGKGGVGKTTVTLGVAQGLAALGFRVGVADCDLESPTLTVMGQALDTDIRAGFLEPRTANGVLAVSVGTMIDESSPVLLQDAQKGQFICDFFRSIRWGPLDYLLLDMPPNGFTELKALLQVGGEDGAFIEDKLVGALVVTEPTAPSLSSVRRTIAMLRMLDIEAVGVVENKSSEILGWGGGQALAESAGIPFLGALPLDVALREAGDSGEPMPPDYFAPLAWAVCAAAGDVIKTGEDDADISGPGGADHRASEYGDRLDQVDGGVAGDGGAQPAAGDNGGEEPVGAVRRPGAEQVDDLPSGGRAEPDGLLRDEPECGLATDCGAEKQETAVRHLHGVHGDGSSAAADL